MWPDNLPTLLNPSVPRPPSAFDPVNKPSHYASGSVECIDAIRVALGDAGFIAYCRGNAMKYTWRAGAKELTAQDLRKGAWYLERAALALEGK